MWNDGVAPETAIDLDAPHVSPTRGLLMFLGGFGFFWGVYQFAAWTDHGNANPAAITPAVLARLGADHRRPVTTIVAAAFGRTGDGRHLQRRDGGGRR